jgi:hypothetical protein
MKRIHIFALTSVFLYVLCALCVELSHAQNFTTVTANNIQDAFGNKLASGQVCFQATTNGGVPIAFHAGGGGQVINKQKCAAVTNGSFSVSVPNTALTNPVNVCYHVTVKDLSTNQIVLGNAPSGQPSGYDCVQPSGASFSFDSYVPGLAPLVVSNPQITIPADVVTLNDPQTITGAKTFTGLTVSKLNKICVVDGTTNATIAACYSALPASGGKIYLPAGSYTVSLGSLTFSTPTKIECESMKTTVITFTGASGDAFHFTNDSNAPTGSYEDWSASSIENCNIVGPGGVAGLASNAGTGLDLGDSTHSPIGFVLRNSQIRGFAIGLTWTMGASTSPWGMQCDHCVVMNNTQDLVYAPTSGTGLAQMQFLHASFGQYTNGMQANGIVIGGTQGSDFHFIDCFFGGDQIVVSDPNARASFVTPDFENVANTTNPYLIQSGGTVTMWEPTFQQLKTGSIPSAFVSQSGGIFTAHAWHATSAQPMAAFLAVSGTANYDISARSTYQITAEVTGSSSGWSMSRSAAGILTTNRAILVSDGTKTAPNIAFSAQTGTGLYRPYSGVVQFANNGTAGPMTTAYDLRLGSGQTFSFSSAADPMGGAGDTGFTRLTAGLVGVGNGTTGDTSGTMQMFTLRVLGATPTLSGTQVGFGNTVGFGNGTSGQAVTTTSKNTGTGPTIATTIVNYLKINYGGTDYWIPLMQ